MATLSIGHTFHNKSSTTQEHTTKNSGRICMFVSCQSQTPGDSTSLKTKREKEDQKGLPSHVFTTFERLGKGLKDNLSPKQKGDWKDLLLMSLSFAVYVYISQRIVCAYCAWVSLLKQHF